ncbi:EscU/YscU/HrcU family type III secretion system export apparatus switch protein, partial [Rhizobiaceae sp. 2RAB30]
TLVMAIIAGVDLIWQRIHWRQDLRMTRQEVKDELKQSDGDPLVKARIRSVARDRARQRMILAVPKATLVIANPTHFSIALRYVREEDAAPVVVAKGQDLIALKIREIAQENNIPIFENVELARSMYK